MKHMSRCLVCNTPMRFFIRKNGYDIYRCPSCRFAQTDLREEYHSFVKKNYSKGYYTGAARYSAYANYKNDRPYIERNLKKFLQIVRKHKSKGKLLDVGCAMGFFVELALKAGYDAYGFDPSSYAVGEAKKEVGKRLSLATIGSASYEPKSFDVITMFDVFEHLKDPGEDLAKLMTLLKDDGILVIATGNTDSLAARLFGRRWTFYIPPQHLVFFNNKNLDRFFFSLGLTSIKWRSIGKWLSLRYLLHLARTTGESPIARILYPWAKMLRIDGMPLYIPLHDNTIVVVKKAISRASVSR